MGKIENEEYKIIIKRIRKKKAYEKELRELEDSIFNSSPMPPDGQPKGNKISNPTEDKAMQLATEERLNFLRKTITTLDKVYNSLDDEYRQVWDKSMARRVPIETLEYELGMSRNTIFRRRRKIVNVLADLWGLR